MDRRTCIIFALTAIATAQQGLVDIAVNAQGELDALTLLQTQGSTDRAEGGPSILPNLLKLGALPDEPSILQKTVAAAGLLSGKAALAEYIAMTLFVVLGCGSAMVVAKEPGWVLQVALTFGFAISSLAYAIGHYSGGQINCAVTFGLFLSGNLGFFQAILNFIAQMLGAVTGALILTLMCPEAKDLTGGIGSNLVADGYSCVNALLGEATMTFLLMFVILETAVNPASKETRALACLAIGFAVFLAHSVLIPITGCSINPTRSFGPAVVSHMLYKESNALKELWVFWLGPLAGAAGAVLVYSLLNV